MQFHHAVKVPLQLLLVRSSQILRMVRGRGVKRSVLQVSLYQVAVNHFFVVFWGGGGGTQSCPRHALLSLLVGLIRLHPTKLFHMLFSSECELLER